MAATLEHVDELIDKVDDQDHVIGTIHRSLVFSARANFRVAHLLIFNERGDLLIQQLDAARTRHPEQWGASAATYVRTGETYLEAIRRAASDELDVTDPKPALLGKTTMVDEGCLKFVSVFSLTHDGPFAPLAGHVAATRFASMADILALRKAGGVFTPTLVHILSSLLSGALR